MSLVALLSIRQHGRKGLLGRGLAGLLLNGFVLLAFAGLFCLGGRPNRTAARMAHVAEYFSIIARCRRR